MRLLKELWNDEAGVLLSAEAAIVGTVAAVGVGAGLNVVASSVNEELEEVAFAIRSIDQSYSIPARKGCGAWTAGSEFKQQPVEQSIKELKQTARKAKKAAKKQSQRLKERVEKQKKQKEDDNAKQQPDPVSPAEA
ncbi:MAG: hypothetical protein ABGZ35_20530 [Planctomycetaceae bacterium]|jgi:hypothetical protein